MTRGADHRPRSAPTLARRSADRRVFAVVREQVSPWGFVGMGGLACLLFLVLGSVVVAPWWLVALLLVGWLVLFGLGVRWFTPHPRRTAWVPVVGLVVWLAALVGGVGRLGWGG